MSPAADTDLARKYRLSAIINGIAGLFIVGLGFTFLLAWLIAGFFSHQLLLLSGLLVTGASLLACSIINFAVMAYHYDK
jgi:predicted tellurium resistance membrane protein TerC